jgi:hypothetical protein
MKNKHLIMMILTVSLMTGIFIIGCSGGGSGGGSSSGSDSGGGGENTAETDVAAIWTSNDTFGALMVHKNGEMLIPITEGSGPGEVTRLIGAMWIDVSGSSVIVYLDNDGFPTEAIVGDFILRYSNWDTTAQTVDIALIYTPSGYIEIFKGASVDMTGINLPFDVTAVTAAIAGNAICFPTCENSLQNLSQLLSITGAAITVGACGVATTVSLGAAAIPCTGLIISTAGLIVPDDWWLNDPEVLGNTLTVNEAFSCATGGVIECSSAALSLCGRVVDLANESQNNSSDMINAADLFLQDDNVFSGVAQAGDGLPSCTLSYECTPGSYMPCYPDGVKQCLSECSWGSCNATSCGDGICESDADENSTNCPSDCEPHPLDGTWSGTYNASGPGDGGCTYFNTGTMSMTVIFSGNSFSGPSSVTGIQLLTIPGCGFHSWASSSSSVSGSISGETLTGVGVYPIALTGGSISFSWNATVTGNTMNGTFTGDDSGSFTLTR